MNSWLLCLSWEETKKRGEHVFGVGKKQLFWKINMLGTKDPDPKRILAVLRIDPVIFCSKWFNHRSIKWIPNEQLSSLHWLPKIKVKQTFIQQKASFAMVTSTTTTSSPFSPPSIKNLSAPYVSFCWLPFKGTDVTLGYDPTEIIRVQFDDWGVQVGWPSVRRFAKNTRNFWDETLCTWTSPNNAKMVPQVCQFTLP